jgi:membrane-anchored protein YejM (alkaline phosphatase superfamily)
MAGQPSALEDLRRRQVELEADAIAFSMSPDIEARRRQREYYLANVTMIDEKLGEILEALEAKGLLNNTIVIFIMRVSASPNTWRRKAYVAFLAAMRRRAENWFSRSLGRIT